MNIVDFFDKIHTKTIFYANVTKLVRLDSIVRHLVVHLANMIIPLYYHFTSTNKSYKLELENKKSNNLIVSLTSYPARIGKIHLVIESILRQTIKPNKIILWLSKQQFNSLNDLPHSLLSLQERGLSIIFVDDDIRSHKKYYYALKRYPTDTLITIDDDIFYRSDMIETLLACSKKTPHSIVANYANRIKYENEQILPYELWKNNLTLNYVKGFDVFFGSGGGTMFSPGLLDPLVLSKDIFVSICPLADDVWLNAMCRINGVDVVKTSYNSILLPVKSNGIPLSKSNVDNGFNDVQLSQVRQYCIANKQIDPFKQTK